MIIPGLSLMAPPAKWNGYKYNGKELQKEMGLNWGDHENRMADYTIGRWWVPDPLADEYPWSSPYAYCSNNPMNRIDPYGRADFLVNKQFLFWNWTKVVGNDGINDGRQLVLKTTQTSFGEGENSINGAGLSKSDLKVHSKFYRAKFRQYRGISK
jgi:RHS repeat-associated protein